MTRRLPDASHGPGPANRLVEVLTDMLRSALGWEEEQERVPKRDESGGTNPLTGKPMSIHLQPHGGPPPTSMMGGNEDDDVDHSQERS